MTTLSSITSIKDALKREQRHVVGMISEMQGEIDHLTGALVALQDGDRVGSRPEWGQPERGRPEWADLSKAITRNARGIDAAAQSEQSEEAAKQ